MKKLVPHNPQWEADFQTESNAILIALGGIATTIHHIGSTSIPGIFAKPIIDILVEVVAVALVDGKNSVMESIGYECMGEYGISGRRYFRKLDSRGVRTHHLHVFNAGSEQVVRHLAFRDYLIAHPAKAR